jgi:hypothetical protein
MHRLFLADAPRKARELGDEADGLGRQRVPHAAETEAGEMSIIAGGELGYTMMSKRQCQPRIEDDATSDIRPGCQAPDILHDSRSATRMVDKPPGRMIAKGLNERNGVGCVEGNSEDRWIAQQNIKLNENQLADGDSIRRGWQGSKKTASVDVFRAITVEGVKEEVRIEGNHRALVGGFVGKQAPICERRLERAHTAALWETPFAVCDGRQRSTLLHQLLRGANKKFRHANVELMGQSFDLLVERVGQLDFGTFHRENLAHCSQLRQAQQQA